MPDDRAALTNFKTISMDTGGANNLEHVVGWESSSGAVEDLAHIVTREHVSWDDAPAEFGPAGEYAGSGNHYGLGQNNAAGGQTTDNHSIIPTGFVYKEIEDGKQSATWMMQQEYEFKTDDGDWQPIPGATYEITRWFERQGDNLVAYCAKRGTGGDSSMHRAMVSIPDYFK
jgi:hypothetical protein